MSLHRVSLSPTFALAGLPALILLLGTALLFRAHAQTSSPPEAGSGPRLIFQQPVLAGIAGNFHVPIAENKKYPTDKPFNLVLWQPNPSRPDGELVPTDWRAGDMTGFYPVGSLVARQAAFRNAVGASTIQIDQKAAC
jgi:hypothetical protein